MKLILSLFLLFSINASSATTSQNLQTKESTEDKIKTISAYEEEYDDIINLVDPLKKNVLIFSVT